MTTAHRDTAPARMTAAEFKAAREHLGLSPDWLARHLNVQDRSLRRWEKGTVPVPDGVRDALADIETETASTVDDYVNALRRRQEPVIVTYRTDDELHEAMPGIDYPPSWHRAVAARVKQRVPRLRVIYGDAQEPNPGKNSDD